jgi:DNA-directed RNA polymerase subunit RPC12/RpoP
MSVLCTPFRGAPITDKIRILCTKCRSPFTQKASHIKPDYQVQCPNCFRLIIFEIGSEDAGVRKALAEARRLKYGPAIVEET